MGIEVDNSKLTDTVGNTNAGTFLDTLLGNIAKPFEWIWANIQTFFTTAYNNISAWISNQTMAISNFFDAAVTGILEGLKELFIPTEDYLTVKVDAMCAEFAFVDSIVRTANELKTGLAGVTTEPPVIYIDLGATRGSYDIGGEVPFLDLRWYSEYKGTVDAIISAFLWICFAWRMLLKLPGIISGMPGDFVMASAHNMGITDYLPSRTKEYEIQRISNREMIRKGPDK